MLNHHRRIKSGKQQSLFMINLERWSDLLHIRERGIPIIVGYMGNPMTKEMR